MPSARLHSECQYILHEMSFGRKEKKYWIVCPGNLSPESLPLGSILGLPYAPDASILNFGRIEPIESRSIRAETELAKFSIERAFNAGLGSKLEISSPLAPLLGVAPSLGLNFKSERIQTLEAKRFRVTTFWNPPDEYVNRALRDTEVLGYIKKSWFSTPVYMVVSVAVAAVVTKEHKGSTSFDGNAGAGVSPPATGVTLAADFSGGLGSELKSSEATVEQDTILAYRVRRIQYERRKDRFQKAKDNDTKFGFFNADRQELDVDEDEDEDYDSDVPGFTYATEVDDDDGGLVTFENLEQESEDQARDD